METQKQASLETVKFRKCKHCRKIINTNDFDGHLKTCRFNAYIQSEQILITCRGCNHEVHNSLLLLHLIDEDQSCMQFYSVKDYVSIAELWIRNNLDDPENLGKIKTAFDIMETGVFSGKEESHFCISCGKSFSFYEFRAHVNIQGSTCQRVNDNFEEKRKCRHCKEKFPSVLLHFKYGNVGRKCKEIFFRHLDESSSSGEDTKSHSTQNCSSNQENQLAEEQRKTCFGCGGKFKINRIMKHISHKPSCQEKYPKPDLEKLQKECLDSKVSKMRKWNDRRSVIDPNKVPKEDSYCHLYEKGKKKKKIKQFLLSKKKPTNKVVNCNGCQKSFYLNRILKHLTKVPSCKDSYTTKEFKELNGECKEFKQQKYSFKKNQTRIESKSDAYHEHQKLERINIYNRLKNKLKELHLKSLLAIDLKKLHHYQWEITKIDPSKLTYAQLKKIKKYEGNLYNCKISLEEKIAHSINDIKAKTAKWCFDPNVQKTSNRQYEDMQIINAKCQDLYTSVQENFHTELASILENVSEIYGQKLNPYRFRHQNKWEYEKPWLRFEDEHHKPPEKDEKDAMDQFIIKEIKKNIKR